MSNDKDEQETEKSNEERDQDEGNMNNGTIGGSMDIDEKQSVTPETNKSEDAKPAANTSTAGK